MSNVKRVYTFGDRKAEGKADMKNLLGGKGANLAEMNLIGVPVPPGFTITTEVCTEYNKLGQDKVVELIKSEVEAAVKNVEDIMGFGKNRKATNKTRISDIDLNEKDVFYYLFDFGDDWWHRIRVQKVTKTKSKNKHIKLTKSVGESPPPNIRIAMRKIMCNGQIDCRLVGRRPQRALHTASSE